MATTKYDVIGAAEYIGMSRDFLNRPEAMLKILLARDEE
jgi:hypothetical protein